MCEPKALTWTAEAGRVLVMIAASNVVRRAPYPTTHQTEPVYTAKDKTPEPVYAGM